MIVKKKYRACKKHFCSQILYSVDLEYPPLECSSFYSVLLGLQGSEPKLAPFITYLPLFSSAQASKNASRFFAGFDLAYFTAKRKEEAFASCFLFGADYGAQNPSLRSLSHICLYFLLRKQAKTLRVSLRGSTLLISLQKEKRKLLLPVSFLERITGLEPATFALARRRSTK